jgi:hypothetical protein
VAVEDFSGAYEVVLKPAGKLPDGKSFLMKPVIRMQ